MLKSNCLSLNLIRLLPRILTRKWCLIPGVVLEKLKQMICPDTDSSPRPDPKQVQTVTRSGISDPLTRSDPRFDPLTRLDPLTGFDPTFGPNHFRNHFSIRTIFNKTFIVIQNETLKHFIYFMTLTNLVFSTFDYDGYLVTTIGLGAK